MSFAIETVTPKTLIDFLTFPDWLYRNDPFYVPYFLADLKKTLSPVLFQSKTYTALLAREKESGQVLGRVLFTIEPSKQLHTDRCGFFSLYECVEDSKVSRALLEEMEKRLFDAGAEYFCGPFFPLDPDNRRGFLCDGYEYPPMLFGSYNPPYYNHQLSEMGYQKQTDTLGYLYVPDPALEQRVQRVAEYSQKKYGFHLDTVNFKEIDRDIRDVAAVMEMASTEIIYEDAPDASELTEIFRSWKQFLWPDLIIIARDRENRPIGMAMALPDYAPLIRKMKGRLNLPGLFHFFTGKNRLTGIKATLQYVIPAYQQKGVILALYFRVLENARKHGISHVEFGTIMEDNAASNKIVAACNGKLNKRYRLYQKENTNHA